MVCSALEESQDENPNDSIITRMKLNISPPEEYSGSLELVCGNQYFQKQFKKK